MLKCDRSTQAAVSNFMTSKESEGEMLKIIDLIIGFH